ncbi:MAG: hypothetical protein QGH76_00300 [Phycisphaerales bacterium]|jgi:hypothetical protein|nr:hypothetical protein [Phycisphaerales bacterium]
MHRRITDDISTFNVAWGGKLVCGLIIAGISSVAVSQGIPPQPVPGHPVTPDTQPWITFDMSKCKAMPGCPGAICDPFYDHQPGGPCIICERPTPQSFCGWSWVPWNICTMGDPSWPSNNCGRGLGGTCLPTSMGLFGCEPFETTPGAPVLYCAQLECSKGSIAVPGGIPHD